MHRPNLKSVSEIIRGTLKHWAVPGYDHAQFLPNFKWAFVWMDPMNVLANFEM